MFFIKKSFILQRVKQSKLETKMVKTQTKTTKTTAKKPVKKEVAPTAKKVAKPQAKVTKSPVKTTKKAIQPDVVAQSTKKKTVVKKKTVAKKAPVKSVTITLEEPVSTYATETSNQTPVLTVENNSRNILQLYFDNWINMFALKGRASRSEFIAFWSVAILLFPIFVPYAVFSAQLSYAVIIASALLIAALFTLSIRRFHDMNRSGFWGGFLFVAVFGILSTLATLPQFTIIYIFSIFGYFVLSLISGTKGSNKYGEQPVKPSKVAIAFNTLLSFSLVFTGVKLVQLLVIFFQGY